MSEDIVDHVRRFVLSGAVSRAQLARMAGLHVNTLRGIEGDDWNPRIKTVRKLEAALASCAPAPADAAQSVMAPISAIIEEARNGRMFILVDDEDRENEGDLIIPAQMATPAAINFMAAHGRGLICLALSPERVAQLGLQPMSRDNRTRHETAFTISIEARDGVSTGISAADRAHTVAVAIDGAKSADHIVTPGHIFPLAARAGGVLTRAGHTEAAVDVARLAGLNPSGVICEIMKDDGTMARMDDLIPFAHRHGLKIGTIRDLIAYRMAHDHLVLCLSQTPVYSTQGGEWLAKIYMNKIEGDQSLVLQKGRVSATEPTLVRVHMASTFGDALDIGAQQGQLHRAMARIADHGSGILVILKEPAFDATLRALSGTSDASGADASGADDSAHGQLTQRTYGVGAQILADLGVRDMVLLTNSRRTFAGMTGYGLRVVDERPF